MDLDLCLVTVGGTEILTNQLPSTHESATSLLPEDLISKSKGIGIEGSMLPASFLAPPPMSLSTS